VLLSEKTVFFREKDVLLRLLTVRIIFSAFFSLRALVTPPWMFRQKAIIAETRKKGQINISAH